MTRFLTTTAVLLSLTGAAYAESHSATPATGSETTMQTNPMAAPMELAAAVSMPTDFMASDLIGMRIYNVEADYDTMAPMTAGAETEWDDIGEINDIVVTADGTVSAVILGVGGFLGIGERDVAVNMGALTVVNEEGEGNDRFLVVKTSKEQLEQLPEFDRGEM